MRTRTDDALVIAVVVALALAACYGALTYLVPRGSFDEVTLFPVSMACRDGADARLEPVPLVERGSAVALRDPDETDGASLDPTPPGLVVRLDADSDLRCVLDLGVANGGEHTVRIDHLDVGGWAPGPDSGDVWEVDPDHEDLVGDVEVVDETVARYVVDEEVAPYGTTLVRLMFRQRADGCQQTSGVAYGPLHVTVSRREADREIPGGFELVTATGDEPTAGCTGA